MRFSYLLLVISAFASPVVEAEERALVAALTEEFSPKISQNVLTSDTIRSSLQGAQLKKADRFLRVMAFKDISKANRDTLSRIGLDKLSSVHASVLFNKGLKISDKIVKQITLIANENGGFLKGQPTVSIK